jgi:hypothetical protein
MIDLILFILGSWLVIVADAFFLLNLASVELDGNRRGRCSVVEPLTLSWGVQTHRPSCLTSLECEVFRRVIEVLHMWQCLLTGLKISSQAIEYLVLGDCKSASPGRNKVNFSTEPLVSTKGKILVYNLLLL